MSRGIDRCLQALARRPRACLLLAAALTVVASVGLLRLEMDTDILSMLPQDDPAVQAFVRTVDARGSTDLLLAVVRCPEGGGTEDLIRFGERLEPKLRAAPSVRDVRWRATPGEREALLELLLGRGLLLLTEEEFQDFLAVLEPEAMARRVQRTRRLLLGPSGGALRDLARADPLGLTELFGAAAERFSDPDLPITADPASGALLSRDGRSLMVVISPRGSPQDIPWAEGFLADVEAALVASREETGLDVSWGLTGGAAIAVSDARTIRADMELTILGSLATVVLLFSLVFRRRRLVLVVGGVLGLGVWWTFGLFGLVLGRLTLATAAFGAILIGLGIDFSIHLAARMGEELQVGRGVDRAVRDTLRGTGRAVVAGALTTAAAFGVLALARFPGLRQLGLMSGVGVLLALLAVLTVLVPLLGRWPGVAPRTARSDRIGRLCQVLASGSIRFRLPILAAGVCLLAYGGTLAWRGLPFEPSAEALRPRNNPPDRVMDELTHAFDAGAIRVDLVLDVPDGVPAEERLVQMRSVLRDLREEGWLRFYSTPLALIPPAEEQAERIRRLSSISPPRIRQELRGALVRAGLRPESFLPGLEALERLLRPEPLRRGDLPPALGELLKTLELPDGGRLHVLRIPEERWSSPGLERALQRLRAIPGVQLTGLDMLNRRLRALALEDLRWLFGLAVLFVLAILTLELRRVPLVLCAALPVTVGIALTVILMHWLGIQLNLMNLVAVPIVVGIGIDDGIHLVRRFLEDGQPLTAARRTGRAVVLTSLTTAAGFGSLILARYRGLASIGLLCLIGVGSCLLASLTVLPAALTLVSPVNAGAGRERKPDGP